MADTTLPGVLLEGDHASRPAAADVASGALYACSTHGLIYQSDLSTWATWATLGGGAPAAHAASHDGGADDLNGDLTPAAHAASHQNGGSDEIDVTGLTGAGGGGGGSGTILQVQTAILNSDVNTTAATLQDSGLSLVFTPLVGTSKLLISVHGECRAERVAGTIAERYMWVAVRNDTDAVVVVQQARGRTLIGTSALQAEGFWPIALQCVYTVNSTTARTFKLQYMAGVVTNVRGYILGATPRNQVLMTIMEIAA